MFAAELRLRRKRHKIILLPLRHLRPVLTRGHTGTGSLISELEPLGTQGESIQLIN